MRTRKNEFIKRGPFSCLIAWPRLRGRIISWKEQIWTPDLTNFPRHSTPSPGLCCSALEVNAYQFARTPLKKLFRGHFFVQVFSLQKSSISHLELIRGTLENLSFATMLYSLRLFMSQGSFLELIGMVFKSKSTQELALECI